MKMSLILLVLAHFAIGCKARNASNSSVAAASTDSVTTPECNDITANESQATATLTAPGGLNTISFIYDKSKWEMFIANKMSTNDAKWYSRICTPTTTQVSGVSYHVDQREANLTRLIKDLDDKDKEVAFALNTYISIGAISVAIQRQMGTLDLTTSNREIGAKIDDWILWFGKKSTGLVGVQLNDTSSKLLSVTAVGAYGGTRVARAIVVYNFIADLVTRRIALSSIFSAAAVKEGVGFALSKTAMASAYGVIAAESAYLIKSLVDIGLSNRSYDAQTTYGKMLDVELYLRRTYSELIHGGTPEFRRNLLISSLEWFKISGSSPTDLKPGTTAWALFTAIQNEVAADEAKYNKQVDYAYAKAPTL